MFILGKVLYLVDFLEESKIKFTKEQLALLRPVERFNFRVMNAFNSQMITRKLFTMGSAVIGRRWIESVSARVVVDHGFENFKKVDPERGVFLVANHRSFNDQFVIAARLFKMYGAHHNIFFPVRSNYFYSNPTGLFVNLFVAMSAMYPPIVRDRDRRGWNKTATDIMVDLLEKPANMIGFHPEGTRNQSDDGYSFLPAKPGAGEIIHRAAPNVIPVFLQGFPDNFGKLCKENFKPAGKRKTLVHMVMGEPIDFSPELKLEPSRKTYLTISQKIMRTIAQLSEKERKIRKEFV